MCSKYFIILCVICCCLVPRATCLDCVNMFEFLTSSFAHMDRKLTNTQNDLLNKIITNSKAMENNFNAKIKEAVDKVNDRTEALAKDLANNHKTNLETLRNVYERLNTLEKTLKDKSLIKSDAIDSLKKHINEDLKEFVDDVTNNVTKQITDQLDKTFEEQIMNLTMREHNSFSVLKEQIINSTLEEQKQFSALKEMINSTTREQELKLFLKEQILDLFRKEQNTAESSVNICQTATVAEQKNKTISREENNQTNNGEIGEPGTKPFTNICKVNVPNTVVVRDEEMDKPSRLKDELDTYMINRTGCRYRALWGTDQERLIDEPYGGRVRVQFSLRSGGYALLYTMLGNDVEIVYVIADGDISQSVNQQREPPTMLDYPTSPGLLGAGRYVTFYLALEHGNLTLGLDCAGAEAAAWGDRPLSSHTLRPVPLGSGARVTVGLDFNSYWGGKLLSHCPLV